jgi:threonine dehydrogenase-like Zn-dependent dehydrogenase
MFTRLLTLRGMRVTATDLRETRLRMAKEFGAQQTIQVQDFTAKTAKSAKNCKEDEPQKGTKEHEDQTAKDAKYAKAGTLPQRGTKRHQAKAGTGENRDNREKDSFENQPFDAAVIAVPSDDVVREAQELVRGGGQVLLFSHTRRGAESAMDLAKICVDEKDLIGSYSADFLLQKEVARLVFSRKLDVRRLITHQFPLERTADAVALASKPTAESLKVVVTQESKTAL